MNKRKSVFIFDVDGVLLNLWPTMQKSFACFHNREISESEWNEVIIDFLHNPVPYIEFGNYFDQSKEFENLPLVEGVLKLLKRLKALNVTLMIVTSVNDKPDIISRREKNLNTTCGNVFDKMFFVGRGNSKTEIIREISKDFDTIFFCDDSVKNVCLVDEIVTHAIWFENEHHRFMLDEYDTSKMKFVKNHQELEAFVQENL